MATFNQKTFQYFDQAHKYGVTKEWFTKHTKEYEQYVKKPFYNLLEHLSDKLEDKLPRIKIHGKSITRPLRQNRKVEAKNIVKDFSFITLTEAKSSLFEWNPGIHIQIGARKDDNLVGVGLYMVSSRQLHALRRQLVDDFTSIDSILKKPRFKKAWGGLAGERYKRFPRGFDVESRAARYLWHKQFYVSQTFTRTEIKRKDFSQRLAGDLKAALPFFDWIRESVGTYKK